MIPLFKIPIPFVNVIQPRPLDDNFQSNCLAGMDPTRHKPWEMFDRTNPLFNEHSKLNSLGKIELFEQFYNAHMIYGSGDRHPNMKFGWVPPIDDTSLAIMRDPESDPTELWQRGGPRNEFVCRCGLKGDVFTFTRIVLADQSKRRPCDKLAEVSQERAVAYLTGLWQNSNRYRHYKQLLPTEVSTYPAGYQYSGYFHIGRYVGATNSWQNNTVVRWVKEKWGISAGTLEDLDVGFVETASAVTEAVLLHPRFNDRSLLVSSGIADSSGKSAFGSGTLLFPYKVDGAVIHLSGITLPITGESQTLSSANLHVRGVSPLFNESDITESNGIRPIFLCDSLINVMICAERGFSAAGVPFWTELNMAHIEPFKKLQRSLGRNHGARIVIAFSGYAQNKPQTLGFIWKLQELGYSVSVLKLPSEFKHLVEFHRQHPEEPKLEKFALAYESQALAIREVPKNG